MHREGVEEIGIGVELENKIQMKMISIFACIFKCYWFSL